MRMEPRFLTVLRGCNLSKIRQMREPEPSVVNEKAVADFTGVVEQTGIQPVLGLFAGPTGNSVALAGPAHM